jgi:type II secretory pathway component PulF
MWKRWDRWKADQLVVFSSQLANLLTSGIPLIPSLNILIEQEVISYPFGKRIIHHLEEGQSFSNALMQEQIPSLFVSFIRAAEEHGDYPFGLKQCQSYYQSRAKFSREIKKATTYPAIVLLLVMGAFLFLMAFVLPRFHELYQTMGIQMPVMTEWMLHSFELIRICMGVVFTFLLIAYLWIRTSKKQQWFLILLHLPFVNRFFRFRITHYVAIQLGALLQAGVPLLTALELIESLSPWRQLSKQIRAIKDQVTQGYSLCESIENICHSYFLPTFSKMVALGESSGRLDESLLNFANGVEMIFKERMEQFTRSLEPILILIIGVFISITVISLFMPMLQVVKGL